LTLVADGIPVAAGVEDGTSSCSASLRRRDAGG